MHEVTLSDLDTASAAKVGAGFQFPFDAPAAFVKLVAAIQSLCSEPDDLYDEVLGLYPRGFDGRYTSTPTEFFPIGSTGMDGEHIGFINRTPEFRHNDFPFAFITPSAANGALCIGSTAQEGLERLISFRLHEAEVDQDSTRAEKIREVSNAAGLTLAPDKIGASENGPVLMAENGEPLRIPVDIPEGYHFEKSADRIGVLAPAATFKPGFITESVAQMDFAAMQTMYEEGFQELLDNGHPGSALLFMKHCHYTDGDDNEEAWEMLSTCYEALNRSVLAEVIRQYEEL